MFSELHLNCSKCSTNEKNCIFLFRFSVINKEINHFLSTLFYIHSGFFFHCSISHYERTMYFKTKLLFFLPLENKHLANYLAHTVVFFHYYCSQYRLNHLYYLKLLALFTDKQLEEK